MAEITNTAEARLVAINNALDDADAPDATEAHALDDDPIIERIQLWKLVQDELVDRPCPHVVESGESRYCALAESSVKALKARLAEVEKQRDSFQAAQMQAGRRNIELEAQLAQANARTNERDPNFDQEVDAIQELLARAEKAEADAAKLREDKQRLDFLSCHIAQINLDYCRPKGEAFLYSGKKTLRELIDIEMNRRAALSTEARQLESERE